MSREAPYYFFATQQLEAFFCANPQIAIPGFFDDGNGVAGQGCRDSNRSDPAVFDAVQSRTGPHPNRAIFALKNTQHVIISKPEALIVDGKVRVPEPYGPIRLCSQPQVPFVVFIEGNNAGFHQAIFGCIALKGFMRFKPA